MEQISIILRENERLHNRRISRLKRRMRHIKYQHQQLAIMLQTELISTSFLFSEKIAREIKVDFGKIYLKPKATTNTWENMFENFTKDQWVQSFRMKKSTFLFVCSLVQHELEPMNHLAVANNHQALSVNKQVAIAIFKLASYAELRVVATLFGVGKSTVHKCLHRFCNALNKLTNQFIYMPNEKEAKEISHQFENICKLPQIIGCIDGTHIPIIAPKDGYRDFVNRKYWTSFNVQAVCDAQLKFRDISCKFPGSAHDANVFTNSGLFKNIEKILPKATQLVNGKDIPYYILGDPAYPLKNWLIKNYAISADKSEISFNAYMNTGRVRIENAFSRLKGRWHILSKRCDLFYKNAPKIIMTCCILHNICEDNDNDYANYQFPEPPILLAQPTKVNSNNSINEGNEIRDCLKNYLKNKFPERDVFHF